MTVQPPAPPVPELMQALQLPKPPTVTGTLVTGASVSIASRSTIAVEVEYTKIEGEQSVVQTGSHVNGQHFLGAQMMD